MKQIDMYVDSVYQNIGGNRQEIQELKAEMKGHLLEAVYELKAEGMTEQEAIDIAIERFGGEKEMRSIVGQLFHAQKTFAKWILITAMAFLIIGGTLLGSAIIKERKMVSVENSTFNQISQMIENQESISPSIQEEIKSLVRNKDNITSIKIYNLRNTKEEVLEYKNQKLNPKWLYSNYHNESSSDKWEMDMGIKRFNDFIFMSLLSGIAIYWTLFTIWAIINAYHHKRLKIGWIMVFAFFNILGYLIYYIFGNRTANFKGA
ncbi:PLDc_N domain-containing protein [Bacillus sp. BRMEA1]|uniref:permease prefix domain 1-containing protein n=1 Tax=Neobacillus endophyticus TaxID=2738405 RepID=UPI0015651E79|nr:permease prefix domain 1-containing protein [Neobacillus endophyticus]NRD76607.1 PLDc_N domain-containing protein [Neobacillus endophyticus]